MSVKAYNDVVKNYHQLCDLGSAEMLADYLTLNKKLAEDFGQNEAFMSNFPRPVPESLRADDTPN